MMILIFLMWVQVAFKYIEITYVWETDIRKSQTNVHVNKTRCSPRTRMLTRILMVQMSKQMDMQSRRTLFCNSVFEQSCTYCPCYQSAVWSGKCRVWSVECKVRSVECKVWSVKCGVWSVVRVECRVWWSVECGVESVECGVWSGKCRVWSVECKVRNVECKVWSGECRVRKV